MVVASENAKGLVTGNHQPQRLLHPKVNVKFWLLNLVRSVLRGDVMMDLWLAVSADSPSANCHSIPNDSKYRSVLSFLNKLQVKFRCIWSPRLSCSALRLLYLSRCRSAPVHRFWYGRRVFSLRVCCLEVELLKITHGVQDDILYVL